MLFWSQIAEAGADRYLKSYCFGTNISTPARGFSFADYSAPRGLETFEPCSIRDFAAYGLWFQQKNIPWVEPVDIENVSKDRNGFKVTLANGESFVAAHVVLATGLSYFAHVPPILASLPSALAAHTSVVPEFRSFRGKSVAVVGGGQSALEAAALLHEAGARPQLLVRDEESLDAACLAGSRPLAAIAIAHFRSRCWSQGVASDAFSRCDPSHARNLARAFCQAPPSTRRVLVAARAGRALRAHSFCHGDFGCA